MTVFFVRVGKMAPAIKGTVLKAAMVGATGAVLSVILLNGLSGVPVGTVLVPKFLVHGVILTTSSVAATFIVPAALPFVSGGSPTLRRFQHAVFEPLVLGVVSMAIESVIAPGAQVVGQGGTLRTIFVGGGAAVSSAYLAEAMGIIPNVLE